jgi:hypothetical protein
VNESGGKNQVIRKNEEEDLDLILPHVNGKYLSMA